MFPTGIFRRQERCDRCGEIFGSLIDQYPSFFIFVSYERLDECEIPGIRTDVLIGKLYYKSHWDLERVRESRV